VSSDKEIIPVQYKSPLLRGILAPTTLWEHYTLSTNLDIQLEVEKGFLAASFWSGKIFPVNTLVYLTRNPVQ
jgi:hypothetical protein